MPDEIESQLTPTLRRLMVDRLANGIMGKISEHGYYLEPEDYKQFLVEVLDRVAGSLDYIGEGKVELTLVGPPLMVNVD